jgi:hypothetical protein
MLPPSLREPGDVRRLVAGPATRRDLASLIGRLAPTSPVGAVGLTRCTFKPGRTLRAYYDVEVGRRRWPVSVTWRAPGHGTARSPAQAEDAERRALHSIGCEQFRSLGADSEALGATVLVWPHDPELSQLATVVDHERRLGAGIEVVRYRPGQRHVLRVRRPGARPFYVKLAAPTGHGPVDRATLDALCGGTGATVVDGEGRSATLIGPVDVGLPSVGASAYPEADGVPISRHRCAGEPARALRLLASLAATLHRVEVADVPLPHRTPADELALVERACQHLVTLAPELSDPIAGVLAAVGAALGPGEPDRLVHGDLKLDHVLTSAPGIELIDLDGMRSADPATDIAKLLAELRFLAIDAGRSDLLVAGAAFAERYARLAPADTMRRAAALEPALLVKMAARRVSLADPAWTRRVAAIVGAADRLVLDGQTGVGP